MSDALPHGQTTMPGQPFIPSRPPILPAPPRGLSLIRKASGNLLDIWSENAFQAKTLRARLLRRELFVCNCPEAVRHVFVDHNDRYERKGPQMRHALKLLLGDGLFISDGDTWALRRRMIAPILHGRHMPQFTSIMSATALELANRWNAMGRGAGIDALSEMAGLTAEIICRSIFGAELGRDRATAVVEAFSKYQARVGHIGLSTFLNLPEWLWGFHGPILRRHARDLQGIVEGLVDEIEQGVREGRASIVSSLLTAEDPETGTRLTREQIRNEAAVLFMAGHETTANSLTWTWYLISQSPETEERLHEEVDRVLGDRPPTLEDVEALPFTRAVFEEAMRLYPPVPVLTREALADDEIMGRPVSKGALILVVPWLLHRHRLYWDNPDAFIPDRFLGERDGMKDIYIPFSRGPRFCAGAAFGLNEAIICLAVLARRFKLRLAPNADVYPVCRLTLRPRGGLPMTLEPRTDG